MTSVGVSSTAWLGSFDFLIERLPELSCFLFEKCPALRLPRNVSFSIFIESLASQIASRHEDASCSACSPKLRFPLLRLRSKRTRPRLRMRTLKRRQSCGVLMRRLSASSEQLHMPQVPLETLHSPGFETLGDASATYASLMPNVEAEPCGGRHPELP